MTLNKLAIIQARMSSSRLPGKVMQDIAGKPMLQHVIERARAARLVDQVVLATTNDPSDDVLQHFCQEQGHPFYRGSLNDVLDRFYRAAFQFQADVIIRLTADCPLLDPKLIDLTLLALLGMPLALDESRNDQLRTNASHAAQSLDFAANRLPPPWKRTLPIGLDVEACSMSALEQAWRQADKDFQREHVMPYFYEGVEFTDTGRHENDTYYLQHGTTPRGFRVGLLNHFPDYGTRRWTVDTQPDLDFVRQVFDHFDGHPSYDWQQIMALLDRHPELTAINADVQHKTAFDVDQRTSHP